MEEGNDKKVVYPPIYIYIPGSMKAVCKQCGRKMILCSINEDRYFFRCLADDTVVVKRPSDCTENGVTMEELEKIAALIHQICLEKTEIVGFHEGKEYSRIQAKKVLKTLNDMGFELVRY